MAEAKYVSETNRDLSLVWSSDIQFCDPGDNVVLSCHFNPPVSAASLEIKWWNKADLVCRYKNGQMTVNREFEGQVSLSLDDLQNGNVFLTLEDVRRSQRGLYICEVIHEWGSMKEYIFLHISSPTQRRRNSMEGILPRMSDDTPGMPETEEQRESRATNGGGRQLLRQIMELRLERRIKKLKLGGQINELKLERHIKKLDKQIMELELEKQIMELEMESQIQELERQIEELPSPALTFHGPTQRRRNSMEGILPRMSDDTPGMPETEEQRESRATNGVERESCDQSTRQTGEENTATDQESPDKSSQFLQRASTSESVISPARARTHAQEKPGATVQSTQEETQESESTEQERSSTPIQSQVQEETSQSVSSLPGDTTQTPEKTEDRTQ